MRNSFFSAQGWRNTIAVLAYVFFVVAPAQADDPAGRIGRISWLSGNVVLNNPSSGEASAAPLNQPITSGDILTTNANSRAEIQIGSTILRLDSGSRLQFDRIDDELIRLFLNNGQVIVKLPSSDAMRDFGLETRHGRFTARNTGIYRIDAEPDSTVATAYYGTLHFESDNSALDINAGQSAQLWHSGPNGYRLLNAINDEFTEWSVTRDQRPRATNYSRYVSPEMTGAEDLDAYGNWSETSDYGAVWYPRAVAADWAPYRNGHWAWIAPWGWTWIGQEPWGFAPFHYGRWAHLGGRWGWVPGVRVARPVYAPAMVAWTGSPGIGISVSFGRKPTAGWFPLAPREVYIPTYRSSTKHVRNVNITHVTNITNVKTIINNPQAVAQKTHYAYRNLPQAVTVAPRTDAAPHRSAPPTAHPDRDTRTLQERMSQATAPIPAQQTERRARQEHLDRSSPTYAPRARDQAAPQTRSDPIEIRRHEQAVPQPRTTQRFETRPLQEGSAQPSVRREREQTAPTFSSPSRNREAALITTIPAQQAVAPQVRERPAPEVARPAPQARSEPIEARPQGRQSARETRFEQTPQQIRQPSPERIERQREAHAPEARASRSQRLADAQRPTQNEQEKQRPRRDEGEKRQAGKN